jgi:hypothetical protein
MARAAAATPGGVLPDVGATAEIYAVLGDADRAFEVMESQSRRRDGGLMLINADPPMDSLKSDLRFQQLLQRIGLPPTATRAAALHQ